MFKFPATNDWPDPAALAPRPPESRGRRVTLMWAPLRGDLLTFVFTSSSRCILRPMWLTLWSNMWFWKHSWPPPVCSCSPSVFQTVQCQVLSTHHSGWKENVRGRRWAVPGGGGRPSTFRSSWRGTCEWHEPQLCPHVEWTNNSGSNICLWSLTGSSTWAGQWRQTW